MHWSGACWAWWAAARCHPRCNRTPIATLAACRDYASRVYDETNRGAIYSINNQAAAPNSGTYLRDYNGTGTLAAQYHNDQIVDDCVRNTGTETNRQEIVFTLGSPATFDRGPPASARWRCLVSIPIGSPAAPAVEVDRLTPDRNWRSR